MNRSRAFPERPFVGVGAVIVQDGRVVLVRRRHEPLAGRWSLPGGLVEVGETLEEAVRREMREETGLDVEVGPMIEVLDRITRDPDGRVRYHYVLVDYLCRASSGPLTAGADVDQAVLADPGALTAYGLTETMEGVIARGMALAREAPRPAR